MKADEKDELRPEYDFSKGVRGKYVARLAKGSNIVVLDPEVAAVFPDSAAVNDALRALLRIIQSCSKRRKAARELTGLTRRASGRARKRRAA